VKDLALFSFKVLFVHLVQIFSLICLCKQGKVGVDILSLFSPQGRLNGVVSVIDLLQNGGRSVIVHVHYEVCRNKFVLGRINAAFGILTGPVQTNVVMASIISGRLHDGFVQLDPDIRLIFWRALKELAIPIAAVQ